MELSKLERGLLGQIHNSKTGQNRYNSHEILDALVTVTSTAIYNCADDHGRSLRLLLDQFTDQLRDAIVMSDHTEDFHTTDELANGEHGH